MSVLRKTSYQLWKEPDKLVMKWPTRVQLYMYLRSQNQTWSRLFCKFLDQNVKSKWGILRSISHGFVCLFVFSASLAKENYVLVLLLWSQRHHILGKCLIYLVLAVVFFFTVHLQNTIINSIAPFPVCFLCSTHRWKLDFLFNFATSVEKMQN